MNHHIAGMPPSLSMSRGRNMYFPCGGPGLEPPHMQRGPCYPMPDDKMGGMPPGMLPHPGSPFPPNRMPCGMMGEFKSPLVEPPAPPIGNSKKKRRTSAAVTPQPSPVLQDLMPQQPSTLGDTIVASNPFDDTPPSMQHHMHMGPHTPMGMSPMHSPHHINPIGPPMSSPMNMNPNVNMGMVGNPLSSPLGMTSPMGSPHMMGMMNGGPVMASPAMSPMAIMNNNMVGGPMTSPLAGSPIMGSPHPQMPMGNMNGPLGSPMNCAGPTPSPNSCSVNAACGGGSCGSVVGPPSASSTPSGFTMGSAYGGGGTCGPSPSASPFGPGGVNVNVSVGGPVNTYHGVPNTGNMGPSNYSSCAGGTNTINTAVPSFPSSSPSPFIGPPGNCGPGPCGPGCGPPGGSGPPLRNIRILGPTLGPPPPSLQQSPHQQPPTHHAGHPHSVPHGHHPQPMQMHPQHPGHMVGNAGGGLGGPIGPPKPLPVSAGKIYPPDQPMVFNPQNPNAPPIYPCGICHKEVHDNDQAILCESGCNFWFHRMCTGLGEAAYQLLTAEVYAEWVCDKCLNSKNIPLVKFKP